MPSQIINVRIEAIDGAAKCIHGRVKQSDNVFSFEGLYRTTESHGFNTRLHYTMETYIMRKPALK